MFQSGGDKIEGNKSKLYYIKKFNLKIKITGCNIPYILINMSENSTKAHLYEIKGQKQRIKKTLNSNKDIFTGTR